MFLYIYYFFFDINLKNTKYLLNGKTKNKNTKIDINILIKLLSND